MNKKNVIFLSLTVALFAQCSLSQRTNAPIDRQSAEENYNRIQQKFASGWNTWDMHSTLTHVFLPSAITVDLNLTDAKNNRMDRFQIGERAENMPMMRPGTHTYDGCYTDISLEWRGLKLRVQSAAEGSDNVILITPLSGNNRGGNLIVKPKNIWQLSNKITVDGSSFTITAENGDVVSGTVKGKNIKTVNDEIYMSADEPVLVCCGTDRTMEEAKQLIQSHADEFIQTNKQKYGKFYELYNAMQTVMAWNSIYDPTIRNVVTPVSRLWNAGLNGNSPMGGFMLFEWDTYFVSAMFSIDNKELAYANAVELTKAARYTGGFVPNVYIAYNNMAFDRSQPPVGAISVWNVYQRYKEKWFLELLYEDLLKWNRWWDNVRQVDGLLCWGSTPHDRAREGITDAYNNIKGATFESGLDNTHMYDNVLYDSVKFVMRLNDVGLSSLYIADCDYMAKIAEELGQSRDADELKKRADKYRKNMSKLWDDQKGFYYNLHTDTKQLDPRTSPTCFYPLLAKVPTQKQAQRMISEHLLNPEEFWGEWIIPTTPHNDPAFKDNFYWRGRIWAPLNFLVYLGLRNYDLPEARISFVEKSEKLLLKSWLEHGQVFENYNATTGVGDDYSMTDKFYHWGALLGFISLIENGYYPYE
ncbi:hypothetical protein AGMMS50262_20560 [Bacteroidia bacterium]|nr:hypothetical protein AGMMS50262_20560 [Bacteroidia bacterium]